LTILEVEMDILRLDGGKNRSDIGVKKKSCRWEDQKGKRIELCIKLRLLAL